jgi:hypothetical protein
MSNTFEDIQIRGTAFRGKDVVQLLLALKEDSVLELERDEENQYDANAIKVFYNGTDIGFIAKESAAWIAPEMDDNPSVSWIARFSHTIPAGKTYYGICHVFPSLEDDEAE